MDDLAELEQFLRSPGFLLMREYAQERWVKNFPHRVKEAIEEAKRERRDASETVQAIYACSAAVNDVITCVERRIHQIKAQGDAALSVFDPSRRGGL